MKLGLQLGYWGAQPPQGVGDLVAGAQVDHGPQPGAGQPVDILGAKPVGAVGAQQAAGLGQRPGAGAVTAQIADVVGAA